MGQQIPSGGDQLSSGLPDDAFVTDGLLTKRAVRAFALAVLAPRPGELLWDLGAGTGSIGIEWCRLHPANRAVAVERHPDRLDRISSNAVRLGVAERLDVVGGEIFSVLSALPDPEAVFVGGGVEEPVLSAAWLRLGAGGRLVAHSVTADSDAVLLEAYRIRGGELTRLSVETAEPIGRFTGFRPARTVTSWVGIKPSA